MRFVSFQYVDSFPRAGVLLGSAVIDLSAGAPLVSEGYAGERWRLIDVLRGAPDGMGVDGAAEIAAAVLDQLGDEEVGALDEIKLLTPLERPNSLRDFYAFEDHVTAAYRQRGRDVPYAWYEVPVFYFGNHSSIYGPDADVPMPRTKSLDYELELACVIGRAGRDILEEDAAYYIAGFMLMNDWSARDVQREEMSVGLGPAKGKDFATSLGPWLVTPDELEELAVGDDRYNMPMIARVNGVERSRGNFRDIYYSFAQMIAHASRDANLYPGDVIGSGTIGTGCLLELTEGKGPWLQPGDIVELEAAGLGVLRNRIIP